MNSESLQLKPRKQRLVKTLYDKTGKRYKMAQGKIDYSQFKILDDGRRLFWIVGDKEIRITAQNKAVQNSFLLVLFQMSIILGGFNHKLVGFFCSRISVLLFL